MRTLADRATLAIDVKKSRFVANCAPVECMEYFSCSSGSEPPSSTSTLSRRARVRIEA